MSEQPPPSEGAPPYQLRVAELPATDRPRERLERLGPQALTSAELLTILLRTGTREEGVLQLAARLLQEHGGLRGLAGADLSTLAAARGLGSAKASTIAAACELGRRLALEGGDARPAVTRPADIARLLQSELELLAQEELRLLVLDTKHRVLAAPMLYRGSVRESTVRVAELFRRGGAAQCLGGGGGAQSPVRRSGAERGRHRDDAGAGGGGRAAGRGGAQSRGVRPRALCVHARARPRLPRPGRAVSASPAQGRAAGASLS